MMLKNRNQEFFGLFLAVLGVLFLLVNNHLLWFGWDALWPVVPFLIGLLLLRVYFARRKPRQLFVGLLLAQLGIFFFLFSSGLVEWERMDTLWPTLTLLIGTSLLALSAVVEPASSSLVFGLFLVFFSVIGYLAETDAIAKRLSEPFVRIWPLALIAAGTIIFLRGRTKKTNDPPAPFDVADIDKPPDAPSNT